MTLKSYTMSLLRFSLLMVLFSCTMAFSLGEYTIYWIDPPKGIDTTKNVRIDYFSSDTTVDSVTVLFSSQTGGGVYGNYTNYATNVFSFDTSTIPSTSRINGQWIDTRHNTPLTSERIDTFVANACSLSFLRVSTDTMFVKPYINIMNPIQRSIFIAPRHQIGKGGTKTMTVGKYYFVVINRKRNKISQEGQLIVETTQPAKVVSPNSDITQFRPTFQWEPVAGVPYYHLLLSDQPINISEKFDTISNASFIWQAITPGSQIQYGTPDPSGLFPAPPPLSPNVKYEWMILNNYGNTKEFTSVNAIPLPGYFTIKGSLEGLTAPDTGTMKTIGRLASKDTVLKSFYMDSVSKGDTITKLKVDTFTVGPSDTGLITLSWRRCDSANIYKVYLYNVLYDSATGIDAAVAIWTKNTIDTFVTLNAKSFLATGVLHVWKVFVENKSGSGIASKKKAFFYRDTIPAGSLVYYSKERIGSNNVTLKFANVKIIPLQGGGLPIDLPTDQNGYGKKSLQLGAYRIAISLQGYDSQTVDVNISSSHPSDTQTFVLQKFPAQIYGIVADKGISISDASITAMSAQGDTVRQKTDALGSFSMYVPVGDWTVYAEKDGYERSQGKPASVSPQQSKNLDTLEITRFVNIISGTIRDSASGKPIIGANVLLSRNGVVIGTANTADNGAYSFSVKTGSGYELDIEREGFSTENIPGITVTTNAIYDVNLKSGLGQISGVTYVTSFLLTDFQFITNSRQGINVIATDASGKTVGSVSSGRGDNSYMLSLPAGVYTLHFTGQNVITDSITNINVTARGSVDKSVYLKEYASIKGIVRALKSGVNQSVNITAHKAGIPDISVTTIAATGSFTIAGLDTGRYNLTYAAQGFNVKTDLAGVDTGRTKDGKIGYKSASTGVDTLTPGSISISFKIKLLDSLLNNDSTQTVSIKYPNKMILKSTDVLGSMGTGSYAFGTNVTTDSVFKTTAGLKILDIDTMRVKALRDTQIIMPHPVKHIMPKVAVMDTSSGKAELKIFVKAAGVSVRNAVSFRIFYRDRSENNMTSAAGDTIAGNDSTIVFNIKPTADSSDMKYYFEVSVVDSSGDTINYSNSSKLFTTIIPPSSKLKYFTVLPSSRNLSNPALLPLGGTSEIRIICQNGSFTTRELDSSSIKWLFEDRPGVITFSQAGTVLKAAVTSDSLAVNNFIDTIRCRISVSGQDTTIKTYLKVLRKAVDNLMIINGGDDKIYSGGEASYMVIGINKSTGQTFTTQGFWYCEPLSMGSYMSSIGKFTSPPGRIGTVTVKVNAFGKTESQELKVMFKIKSDTVMSMDSAFRAFFRPTVFSGASQDFLLKSTPVSELPVLKSVNAQTGIVVSSLFELSFGTVSQAAPSDSMDFFIRIPREFSDKEIFAGVWNQKKTRWEIIGSTQTLDNAFQILSNTGAVQSGLYKGSSANAGPGTPEWMRIRVLNLGSTSGNKLSGEYALLISSKAFGIYNLKIGPSPFSPFVIATDGILKWPGLRIEFDVATNQSSSVSSEVRILNIEGNIIRKGLNTQTISGTSFKELYSLNTNGGFFGNQTYRRVYFWDGTNDLGRICRNGRYLVKIMVDDGVKKTYKSVPVVLFK